MKVALNNRVWRIFTVYSQNVTEIMNEITKGMEETEEECLIIGGDFNARMGEKGGPIREENEEEHRTRKSKNKIINKEGKALIEKVTERGWMILNGSYEDEGGWTFVGEAGMSVIDYIVANGNAEREVSMVREGEREASDHLSLEVEIPGVQEGGKENEGREGKGERQSKKGYGRRRGYRISMRGAKAGKRTKKPQIKYGRT